MRFGIISQVSSSLKCATNTVNKYKRTYYRLRISGKAIIQYHHNIGFVSCEKKTELNKIIFVNKKLNTNLDIIPNLSNILQLLRKKYSLTQYAFNMPSSSYQHYERGDRYPSIEKLKKICEKYNSLNK